MQAQSGTWVNRRPGEISSHKITKKIILYPDQYLLHLTQPQSVFGVLPQLFNVSNMSKDSLQYLDSAMYQCNFHNQVNVANPSTGMKLTEHCSFDGWKDSELSWNCFNILRWTRHVIFYSFICTLKIFFLFFAKKVRTANADSPQRTSYYGTRTN